MYLSRLRLDLNSFKTRYRLLNPYTLHQAISRAFPDRSEGGPGRVLYRLDEDSGSSTAIILVQSQKKPDWKKADYLSECFKEEPAVKIYQPKIIRGALYYFRLRANPTVKRGGKRYGLLREEEQIKWLNRKASDSGFTVLGCRTTSEGIEKSKKYEISEEDAITLSFFAVKFDGVLRAENPDLIRAAIENGIGPGKGFGFGMLSIAPVKD